MKSNRGPCRACRAEMIWATMPSGKNNPLDPEMVPLQAVLDGQKGVIAYYDGNRHGLPITKDNIDETPYFVAKGATLHISHWATCPARRRLREETDSGETRECPVEGCANHHPRSQLMCRHHWRNLPKPLRDELWRAYNDEGVVSEAYVTARDACIAHADSIDAAEDAAGEENPE